MLASVLTLIALLSAFLTIASDYGHRRRWVWFAKPFTLVCLMGLALSTARTDRYASTILVGLGLSLLGDVFLMLDKARFYRHGLFAFLLAHLAYIVAFGQPHDFLVRPSVWLPLALLGLGYYVTLSPRLGRERLPVAAYVAVISLMGMQGLEMALAGDSRTTWLAALGALIFMASDATHAWNRFCRPFRAAQGVILSTYFLAQWLIAYSLLPG